MKKADDLSFFLNLKDIRSLCHVILNKLDVKSSTERTQKIQFPINEEFLPTLYDSEEYEESEILQDALVKLIKHGLFHIKETKKDSLFSFNQKKNAKLIFNYDWENYLREFYNRNIIKDKWFEITNSIKLDGHIKEIVLNNKILIPGKEDKEIINKLVQLLSDNNDGKSIRHISAQYFWGLSKVLDNKTEIIDYCHLQTSPVILHIKSFSNNFKNILFIENLDTFNEVINSTNSLFHDYLIVYSSGFKASAKRLRTIKGSKLFFDEYCSLDTNSRGIFKNWLYEQSEIKFNVFFWGDLDNSGINIFLTIKKIFPELGIWRIGYEELIKAVENNDFHSPEESNKEGQLDILLTGSEYIDTKILPILKSKKFVDQEYIDIEKL